MIAPSLVAEGSVHVLSVVLQVMCLVGTQYSLFEIGSAVIYCSVVNALGGKAVTTIHAVTTCQRPHVRAW